MDCTLCRDTGWLIEAKEKNKVVTLEMIPCLIPDCVKSGQKIALMSVHYMHFSRATLHPEGKYIMSLRGGD